MKSSGREAAIADRSAVDDERTVVVFDDRLPKRRAGSEFLR